jgi:sortase A
VRKVLGLVLCLAGIALLAFAARGYAMGYVAREHARSQWERARAHAAVAAVQSAVTRASGGEFAAPPGAPIARLVIPRLGIDEIVVEGVGDAELRAGPGHMRGSALPGARGNSVISAHRDRHFRQLAGIALGDTVTTETLAGVTTWIVTGREVVRRGAPALYETDEPTLTLTTCWPMRLIGPAPERLLVELRPAGTAIAAAAPASAPLPAAATAPSES